MSDESGAEKAKADSTTPIPSEGVAPNRQPQNVVVIPLEAVQKAAESGQSLSFTIETVHAGPLPAPSTLRAYDDVYPGLTGIIIDQFQAEGRHRRQLQSIGQIGALGIALVAILCGSTLGYLLGSWPAALAVIGPVCGGLGTAQLLEYWFKG